MFHVPAGLRSRLAMLLSLAIVPALALLTVERIDQQRQHRIELRDQALSLARLAAQAQRGRIENARQLLIALTRSSELHRDVQTCTRFVRGLATEYSGIYTEIGWADTSGTVVCHALDGPEDISIADRSHFQRVMSTGSFVSGDLMYGKSNGAPALAFAHPVRNASGALKGVAFVNMDLRALSTSLKADVRGHDATVSLVDRHGAVLARSANAGQFTGFRGTPEQVQIMSRAGELATEFAGPDSVVRVYGVVTIRDRDGHPDFFIAVGLPRAPLVAAVQRRLYFDLFGVVVLGVGLAAACWVGSDYLIRRPINRLIETTESIASGRLDARVDAVGGVRELDVLGNALNNMTERLQQRDLHLRRGQRLEAIGQLAGGIAHDFNNLLTVIIGYGESLRHHLVPGPEPAHELSELRVAADRAARLTQQLLAFSRQQVLQPKPLNLNDVIAQIQSLVKRTIGDEIVVVMVNGANLGTVLADQAQIEQVILNLVINARDAMPDGGRITVETANSDLAAGDMPQGADAVGMSAGRYVLLSVTDTGQGMNENTRGRIFEPFFTTKGHLGTGLGLATVYGIVKQSGGFIFCDSEPGRGTQFRIYLPRTNEAAGMIEARHVTIPSGGQEAILVVEDQENVREYVQAILTRAGYQVTTAANGGEAAACLSSGAPVDLLLTDVKMPGLDGRSLYNRARIAKPALPVLFMSGYAPDVLAPEWTHSSEASFLQKPFTSTDLLAKVRQTLDAVCSS